MEVITKATPSLSVDGFTFDLQRFDGEVSTWDGTVGTVPDTVNGVITITTAEQLAALAVSVNDGNNYSGVTIKLGADLDLNGQNWTPIGKDDTKPFYGTFDGGGYTISNLTINSEDNYVGLFGLVYSGGTVKNVTLDNVNVSGNIGVGGLIGYNGGTVTGNTVTNATASGTGYDIGGVVGGNGGTVSGNTVFSNVSGNYSGGVVGFNYTSGTVSGNCYYGNSSVVSNTRGVTSNTRLYIFTAPEGVTVTGGDDYKVTVNGTTYYKEGATFTLTVTDFPEGKYLKGATVDDGNYTYTPSDTTLEWADIPTIEGLTFDMSIGAFKISTGDELQALATYVNAGNDASGWTFKLTDDIDLSTVENFAPIGKDDNNSFKGTFDGGGYTISNLTITGSNSYVGLFGYVEGGTVQNVKLTNATISGYSYVGGVAGYNYSGTVQNCSVSGTASGTGEDIGGVVGGNRGTVSGNTVFSNVSGNYSGGVVGRNRGTVSGNTSISTVSGKYSGGVVGYNYTGYTVSGNYYYSNKGAINNSDDSSNTRLYTLAEPEGVTAEYTGGDDYKVTINGTTYYKEGATFTLTVTDFPEGKYLKGATADDGNYTYTMSNTALEWADIPIEGLSFDTANNVFTISTAAGLQSLATYVNAGNDCNGWTFKLADNINLSTVENFAPIGNYNKPFKGTFDGDGYTISNLTITGSNSYVGLFGYVGTGGTVKNITLDNVNVSGGDSVGGLIGYNGGTVTGNTVTNATARGTGEDIGGVVGGNGGTVSGNTVFSNVSGVDSGVVVGYNYTGGSVSDNCYYGNSSVVSNTRGVTSNTRLYIFTAPEGVTVTGGDDYKVTINGTTYYKEGATFTLTVTDFPEGKYLKGATADDGNYTYTLSDTTLEWADIPTIEGLTFDRSINGFKISTAADLQSLATYVNAGNDCTSLTFKLTDNIDLSTVENFAPIGKYNYDNNIDIPFKGTFDGGKTYDAQGNCTETYTISNLTINSKDDNVGLFGYVATGGTIKNVKLTDVDVTGGNWGTGALIGYSYATVENCSVIGGKVTGEDGVGGLIGDNDYTVTGCTVGNVSVTATYANGYAYVGGLAGYNYGYNDGTVSGNIVIVSNISHQRDNDCVGAFVGYNNYGTVSDNYYYSTFEAVGENDEGTVGTNTLLNKVTLPGGVTASGDTCFTVDGIAYAVGNITLAAKTGYIYSGTTTANITADIDLSNLDNATLDPANHYAFKDGDGYTFATADNVASNNYPDLVQVYELTVPDSLTVSGDIVATADGKTYAAGEVTLTAAKGYTIQSISVNGTAFDGTTFTVDAATEISAESFKSINGGKGVEVVGTTGDFSAESGVYSITASRENSTLVGNTNNNNVIIAGGGENILTGRSGNDTFKFSAGGGIVTDYGIGATKSGDGKTLSAAPGSDVVKVSGNVTGIYFDRNSSSKKSAKFTAIVTYDSTAVEGDDTQIIVLQNINKKPTKYGKSPVYQTNDVAAATMKIWDTSGSKQAVLSASKLKALFHDDSDLSELVQSKVTYLGEIAKGETPTTNPFEQTAQATFNGNDKG